MAQTNKKTFRYERKFKIENASDINLEEIILNNPGFFSEIYQERYIHNIYLDTEEYKFFQENINGISQRKKIRIRWYGKKYGYIQPTLEIKEKSGQVGTKYVFDLPKVILDPKISRYKLKDILKKSNLSKSLESDLNSLNLTLMNSYKRKYYLSLNKKIRLTLDTDLKYFQVCNLNSMGPYEVKDPSNIIELKYLNTDDFFASEISNHLPFRMTKSSKYIDGIKLLKNI